MDELTGEVLDRLRSARSLSWLRAIDAAELDSPARTEPDADLVVAPYRWLLDRVGDGVKLTQAGYLPPAMVTAAMTEWSWADNRYGKNNREDITLPVLELRESAQRFGLLRKYRGQLLRTKIGRTLTDHPTELWWHLASALPDARSEPQRHAGVLYLIMVAAGLAENDAMLAEGMTILGWTERGTYQRLSPTAAFVAARDTWVVFRMLGLVLRTRRSTESHPPAAARRLARAALLGRDQPRGAATPVPPRRTPESALQLRVSLRDTEVWRRLVVPASLTLRQLHAVLQTAMGWEDYHLHLFDVNGVLYGDIEEIEGQPLGDEETFTLAQAADAVSEFMYEYDFGDSWHHVIVIEQTMPSVGTGTPHLIDGAGACPPEDCGGTGGFEHLLEVLSDSSDEEQVEMLEWVGGGYDPDAFDIDAVNAALELYERQHPQAADVIGVAAPKRRARQQWSCAAVKASPERQSATFAYVARQKARSSAILAPSWSWQRDRTYIRLLQTSTALGPLIIVAPHERAEIRPNSAFGRYPLP